MNLGHLAIKIKLIMVLVFQLGFYLKEYIKSRQLWDIFNPVMVHCGQDPLGAVFGVPTFSVSQVK